MSTGAHFSSHERSNRVPESELQPSYDLAGQAPTFDAQSSHLQPSYDRSKDGP